MKKILVLSALVLFALQGAQASILTNTNQSAQWVRMLSRNASTDIDAVYYNPAGLTKLANGFHIALHNQSLFQTKTVTNGLPLMNKHEFVGNVSAPIFPSAFIAYKMGRLALSFGFGPNSGGGSADFSEGLPSIEALLSISPFILVPPILGPTGAYEANVAFKGSSVFMGFQVNASYAVTDWMSVALGGRYLSAKNTYEGSITGMMIQTIVLGWIPVASMQDAQVDAEETGSGFTPILSLNFTPMENLNVSLRYEFQTKVELTTAVTRDDVAMFTDGEIVRSDLPAMLSFGLGYSLMPKLRLQGSFNYWFDKDMDWDGDPENLLSTYVLNLEGNSWDAALGFEYDLSETFCVSAGFLHTQFSVGEDYQSDLRHELSSNSIALGGKFKLSEMFDLNFGALYGFYDKDEVQMSYGVFGTYPETYSRSSFGFSIGFGAHL